MTRRQELKAMGLELVDAIPGAKSAHPFIGTWLSRPGVSLEIRLTHKALGKRVVVHKWDNEETCEVKVNEGDFWRHRVEPKTYGEASGVAFDVQSIAAVATQIGA